MHGFPDAPGLLEASRQPLHATGLGAPWLAVHGNHEQMIQGTIPPVGLFADEAVRDSKALALPAHWSTEAIMAFCRDIADCRVDALERWTEFARRSVTPDLLRRAITRAEFVSSHFAPTARPVGHGFSEASPIATAYYRCDHGPVTVLALATVNEHGGWQGSLERAQTQWVQTELRAADRERRCVVLAAHHPLSTLVNDREPDGESGVSRVLIDEFSKLLAGHPSLVLWLNGHTHRTTITAHGTWWEVTAPSLIDFPQQARIVELLRAALPANGRRSRQIARR